MKNFIASHHQLSYGRRRNYLGQRYPQVGRGFEGEAKYFFPLRIPSFLRPSLLRRDLPHHPAAVAVAPAAMGATGLGSAEKVALRVHNHTGGGT